MPAGRSTTASRIYPLLGWYGLIFACSSIPGNRIPPAIANLPDAILHFFLYLPLGFVLARARAGHPSPDRRSRLVFVLLMVALLAFLALADEAHQLLVPGRFFSLFDLAADIAGGTLGAIIFSAWKRRFNREP